MKKKIIIIIITVFTAGASICVGAAIHKNVNPTVKTNIEVLADGEGPTCTGPKKENIVGNIFCHCENTVPCRDLFGCK